MGDSQPPPPKWTSADATTYLQEWQVEQAVQEAVNSAIAAKAADPVLHIADFLEARGRELEAAKAKAAEEQQRSVTPQVE